ncbi:MAG: sugar kinase [Paracoccaceae bacterium]
MSGLRIACIGECMIELSRLDLNIGAAKVGFAGDTLNTATYLARLGANVSFITNLGHDAFSTRMLENFRGEGIDTTLIGLHETRLPGIYSIETDQSGERSFRYWRETSAARTLFTGTGATLDDLAQFDVIYLSGITLAILSPEIRAALTNTAARLRDAGKQIVFDTNYRPRLWPDEDTARQAFTAMWQAATLALPSFDDEQRLYPGTTPAQVIARIAADGPAEVVLKNGAAGPLISHLGKISQCALPPSDDVIDTSGAGDSFNAGYLAARLNGATATEAAAAGHTLATRVIAHHGAVIPKLAMPTKA